MKILKTLSILVFFAFTACQQSEESIDLSKYPETLQKVFEAHGGLENWNKFHGLSFDLVKEEGAENHKIDLKNRRDVVTGSNFTMGNDGENIWLEADTSAYKGNAAFYHNLMFYFYAMPFVLADDGIVYSETEPLEFDGKTYPGVHIAFNDGVGQVSTDEYKLFYDPETYKMTWLAYTVTFKTAERNDNFGWINYDKWEKVNGFLLPTSLTWYQKEEGIPTTPRGARTFENIQVIEAPFEDATFAKTEKAFIVE